MDEISPRSPALRYFNADDDVLEKLLNLNLELYQKEQQGLTVIGCRSPYL